MVNKFELSLKEKIGEKNFNRIQSVTIGIAGAGGLGSNCAFNLARCGFKSFVIIDNDEIEYSNLNRQFYFFEQAGQLKVNSLKNNLLKINPDINIRIKNKKITEDNIKDLFKGCDIIVEAFDKVSAKKIIIEKFIHDSRLLVTASGLAGWGNSDDIVSKKINDSFYMIGDFKTEASKNTPPISPRVNIAAGKQADIILDYLLE